MSTVISLPPNAFINMPFQSARRRLRRKGFSMIELMVVIGIIAAMVLAAFWAVPVIRNNIKSSDEANAYMAMSNDVRTVYSTQGNFNGVNSGSLIKLGVVPSNMVRNDTIISTFDTLVTVAPTNLIGTNDGVEFSYTIPREACTKFVQKSAVASARVTVGSTVVLNRTSGDNRVDVNALGDACDSGAGGNVNILLAQGR